MTAKPLEEKIHYRFADATLLETALTHASLRDAARDNERLEFLGDRVLGLAVADMLFTRFPAENEGSLAKRLTALVQQKALVRVAKDLGLGAYLKLSAGEAKSGGGIKDKILSDATEALIGAIYRDGGFAAATQFIKTFWTPLADQQDAPPEDSKSRLQEWAQSRGLPLPAYRVISRSGVDHAPEFEVEVTVDGLGAARASAPSKRAAEKDAARALFEKTGETS